MLSQNSDQTNRYHIIGLMSGSSLDGLDIAYCIFEKAVETWTFSIVHADCIEYNAAWKQKLANARSLDGLNLWKLHADYGHYLAASVNAFIDTHHLHGQVDLIASHGHTIFHFPAEKFTTQIGDGASLAALTGIMVACDFRTSDIALGGQGTPIVPIGDKLLFGDYNYLLNLGGIANLSVKNNGGIMAYDICVANQVLNHYASLRGMEYDRDGLLAASGSLHQPLLAALSDIEYYKQKHPKSLDNGFISEVILPIMESFDIAIEDKMHTYCEHIAKQLAADIFSIQQQQRLERKESDTMLVTGGGAFNSYLIAKIHEYSPVVIHVPSAEIVLYKEALVMAFIGLLRWRKEVNVLASVTGALRDSVGGAIYHP